MKYLNFPVLCFHIVAKIDKDEPLRTHYTIELMFKLYIK